MARSLHAYVCIMIAVSMVSVVLAVPGGVAAYALRDPIIINGDRDFVAANGVTGGSGTAADPYVIEGWEISASTSPGIQISSTDSYFIIRNVEVRGSSSMPGGSWGVLLERVSNALLDSVEVTGCYVGIIVRVSSDVTIERCIVHDNTMGVRLVYCDGVSVLDNTVYSSLFSGIGVAVSTRCIVKGNQMTENGAGLVLQSSTRISVTSNIFTKDGITITGKKLAEFDSHAISSDNLVNGLPVYYYVGVQGLNLENVPAGEIILVGCDNVELKGMTLAGSSVGVEIAFSEVVFLDTCNVQDNLRGLLVTNSFFIVIRGCALIGNVLGATLESSDFVNVYECQFVGNDFGLSAYDSTDILVGSSTFTGNMWGVQIELCSRVIVSGNHITTNEVGMILGHCTKTWVYRNDISHNSNAYGYATGMQVWGGKKLVIEQNNFIGNDIQVVVFERGDIAWDNGLNRGNHWSDYTGADTDGDLVGETPYVIDSNNQDNFPLVVPYPI